MYSSRLKSSGSHHSLGIDEDPYEFPENVDDYSNALLEEGTRITIHALRVVMMVPFHSLRTGMGIPMHSSRVWGQDPH